MYKKQLAIQKIVCIFCIIAAALSFLYSLGIITDIYDSLYSTMWNPNDLTKTDVPGSIIYYDMQNFNAQFVNVSVGLILMGAFLFITNTHSRRRYYIGNYAAIAIYSVATLAVTVWSHFEISAFKVQFLTTVDFEAMKSYSELWGTPYIDSTFMLDLHYAVAAAAVLSVAALVGNMVGKILLMREEAKLIEEGKGAAV